MIYSTLYDKDIEKVRQLGANAPQDMEDMMLVYADRFSDERQIQRAIDAKDNLEPVHWGLGHHCHLYLHDRELVKKHLGFLLETLPLDSQWMDGIQLARSHEDDAIRERRRRKDEDEKKSKEEEQNSEYERWLKSIPPRFRNTSILDFGASTEKTQAHIMQGGSLLMIGPTGTKKSSFLWAMAKEITKNLGSGNVTVMNLRSMFSEARSYGEDWVGILIQLYGSVPWLFIDEVDKVEGSNNDFVMVSALIDHRYQYGLSTVCAGNGTIESLIKKLGDATVSRLIATKENGMLVNLDGNRDERNS